MSKIAIVSTCSGAANAYCDKTRTNHKAYADRHGYDYVGEWIKEEPEEPKGQGDSPKVKEGKWSKVSLGTMDWVRDWAGDNLGVKGLGVGANYGMHDGCTTAPLMGARLASTRPTGWCHAGSAGNTRLRVVDRRRRCVHEQG